MSLNDTLTAVAIRNAGIRKGFRAIMFLAQWGTAADDVGRPVSADELAVWWKESRATTFRNQAAFREAFPDEDGPERLWSLAHVVRAQKKDQAAVVAHLSSVAWAPPEGRLL